MAHETGSVNLSENYLRARVSRIGKAVDNDKLVQLSRNGFLDEIVSEIISIRRFDFAVNEFFKGFPDKEIFTDFILKYKDDTKSLQYLLENLVHILSETEDINAAKTVAETAFDYRPERLESFMKNIGQVAYWTGDSEAVKAVAQTAGKYDDERMHIFMDKIASITEWTKSGGAVTAVSEAVRDYNKDLLEDFMDKTLQIAFHTAYSPERGSAVKAVAENAGNYKTEDKIKEFIYKAYMLAGMTKDNKAVISYLGPSANPYLV